MTNLAEKHATYQDIIDLPENRVGEIINGQLETHPRPAPKHALASSSIGGELISPFQRGKGGPGGWWILDEPECHLGSDVFVPDLAGWRKERMPSLPETAWFEVVPDWICEILSPSTARIDRIVKMPIYAKLGVKHLWLIDPLLQTLEAYALQDSNWSLIATFADDANISIAPFAEHSFSLSVLWE
jgi:Uma2 family endonuclease